MRPRLRHLCAVAAVFIVFPSIPRGSAQSTQAEDIDIRVQAFLENHQYQWRYENVAEEDGRVLFNLIVENNYTQALDIGTSTGHSAIWIAWALSKTGGRLITIEIDEGVGWRGLTSERVRVHRRAL